MARARHIHNFVTKVEESLAGQGLGEEIGHVVLGGHERHTELTIFDALADEVMSPLDMLRLRVVLRVVGKIDGRLVV